MKLIEKSKDIIVLPPIIGLLCKDFAVKCAKTNIDEYAKRNQKQQEKIVNDIYVGKLAELAVYYSMKKQLIPVIQYPDLTVYPAPLKSFACDIQTDMHNIHVKAQNKASEKAYGTSWLCEKKDKVFTAPGQYDMLIGCVVDDIGLVVSIEMIKLARDIKWSEPKLKKLQTKVAIYLEENL